MLSLREQAISLLEQAPEDQMGHIVSFLEGISGAASVDANADERLRRSQQAYKNLQQYRRAGTPNSLDIDWKKERADGLAAKYESLG